MLLAMFANTCKHGEVTMLQNSNGGSPEMCGNSPIQKILRKRWECQVYIAVLGVLKIISS